MSGCWKWAKKQQRLSRLPSSTAHLGRTFICTTDGRGKSEQVSKWSGPGDGDLSERIEMLCLMASLGERKNLTGQREPQANNRALQCGLYVHLAFSCFRHAKNKTSWKEGHVHCLIMSSLSTLMPLCCDVKRSFQTGAVWRRVRNEVQSEYLSLVTGWSKQSSNDSTGGVQQWDTILFKRCDVDIECSIRSVWCYYSFLSSRLELSAGNEGVFNKYSLNTEKILWNFITRILSLFFFNPGCHSLPRTLSLRVNRC